ncbi:phosphotransferase system eiib component type 2/3 [Lucifera butyrica]|uniref:Phosphotransferase system eiib component type 2/3 n=1 Tax=Lucifera butyrica TaxID=1351585 RepID=A0A498R7W2_9FIRM|nr:PTS sugar transporter subunit IIB [Lucifera butyrica]VBB07065.1 phosphotransferase system eiib component type 2/3 [Lucifera butyrica]
MNILLVCAAGMSTSLVVEKMKKALKPEEADSVLVAIPAEEFEAAVDNYDIVLLGPQLRFKKKEFEKITQPKGIPLDVINMVDYGTLRGDKIMEFARQLYQQKSK